MPVGANEIIDSLITVFAEMEYFGDGDITKNDFSILDGPTSRAPYLIVKTPDHFRSTQQTLTPETVYDVILILFVRFTDWTESFNEFSKVRDAMIDKVNSLAGERSARQTVAITLDEFTEVTPILPYYDPLADNSDETVMPLYLFQQMTLGAKEY